MRVVTDLHLHSQYSRAVSPRMNLQTMSQVAAQKGIDLISAADFTHPQWFEEIRTKLEEAEEGLYILKGGNGSKGTSETKGVRFLLSTEIASIYKQNGKLRRVHNLVFVPSFEVAEKVNNELIKRGCNLTADGRPIIGLSSKALLELILSFDARSMLIPAHIWTPHFGIYGSASGFDSLEEAFEELVPYVYGIETGLSSDPAMNWQTEELMHRSILSFSDAHSLPRMGREATVMELSELTYENVRKAIMRPSLEAKKRKEKSALHPSIVYTLEFYPEEGKYHFSGHRNCNVVYQPDDVKERGTTCPVCTKRLTEGVFMRVVQLSEPKLLNRVQEQTKNGMKWYSDRMQLQPPFIKLVPLLEIVAASLGMTVHSQKVQKLFERLCLELRSELFVLLHASVRDIQAIGGERLAQCIVKVRAGDISIDPGFDGVYGRVSIFAQQEEDAYSPRSKMTCCLT